MRAYAVGTAPTARSASPSSSGRSSPRPPSPFSASRRNRPSVSWRSASREVTTSPASSESGIWTRRWMLSRTEPSVVARSLVASRARSDGAPTSSPATATATSSTIHSASPSRSTASGDSVRRVPSDEASRSCRATLREYSSDARERQPRAACDRWRRRLTTRIAIAATAIAIATPTHQPASPTAPNAAAADPVRGSAHTGAGDAAAPGIAAGAGIGLRPPGARGGSHTTRVFAPSGAQSSPQVGESRGVIHPPGVMSSRSPGGRLGANKTPGGEKGATDGAAQGADRLGRMGDVRLRADDPRRRVQHHLRAGRDLRRPAPGTDRARPAGVRHLGLGLDPAGHGPDHGVRGARHLQRQAVGPASSE